LCGAPGAARALCEGCEGDLPRLAPPLCAGCALPLDRGGLCGACLAQRAHYDGVIAACRYAFPIDALIHACKYGARLAVAPLLGALLARAVAGERADAIVPMPLSAQRLRERGFNQALEIARAVGRAAGIAVLARACRKPRETPPQAALPWKARRRNVRGAFVCDIDLAGRHIAVVDDVMTTGATLDELARVLKRAGAARVSGWVLARALRGARDAPERWLTGAGAAAGRRTPAAPD
jgi:ComF family protein